MAKYSGTKYDASIMAITGDRRGQAITVKSYYTHPDTSTKLTDGDIVNLCVIPANHEIVGLEFFCGALDSATALVVDVGLCDAADTALDLVYISGSTLARGGGTLATPATAVMHAGGPISTDKVLAVEVTTTATGAAAAPAAIGCIVTYVPA